MDVNTCALTPLVHTVVTAIMVTGWTPTTATHVMVL